MLHENDKILYNIGAVIHRGFHLGVAFENLSNEFYFPPILQEQPLILTYLSFFPGVSSNILWSKIHFLVCFSRTDMQTYSLDIFSTGCLKEPINLSYIFRNSNILKVQATDRLPDNFYRSQTNHSYNCKKHSNENSEAGVFIFTFMFYFF